MTSFWKLMMFRIYNLFILSTVTVLCYINCCIWLAVRDKQETRHWAGQAPQVVGRCPPRIWGDCEPSAQEASGDCRRLPGPNRPACQVQGQVSSNNSHSCFIFKITRRISSDLLMRSPQLVYFILCTSVIYAVNDVWFSKQNLCVWKLCDKTATQRAGGSYIGNAPNASVRISASLSATMTRWQKVFVIWFSPSMQFVPRLDHDRFLPKPFWFIRHHSPYTWNCKFWVMDVVKINHRTVFVWHTGYRLLRTQYNHRRPLQSVVHTAVERAVTLQSLESTSDAATADLRRQSLLFPQYEIWFGLD